MAHPRSRGENLQRLVIISMQAGSSPLMQGKLGGVENSHSWLRLIPAHAGKTVPARMPGRSRGAHPRSRGENTTREYLESCSMGSSPFTRGKLEVVADVRVVVGLIPAYAGKTVRRRHTLCSRRVHPHSRGENEIPSVRPSRTWGSSPLMRGKPAQHFQERVPGGLIPAYAGKTVSAVALARRWRAHPRSYGENAAKISPT